jgi:hypothetical protein
MSTRISGTCTIECETLLPAQTSPLETERQNPARAVHCSDSNAQNGTIPVRHTPKPVQPAVLFYSTKQARPIHGPPFMGFVVLAWLCRHNTLS